MVKVLERDEKYPFVLIAGSHMYMNSNTLMRNPGWNANRCACTLAMNPGDVESLNFSWHRW